MLMEGSINCCGYVKVLRLLCIRLFTTYQSITISNIPNISYFYAY